MSDEYLEECETCSGVIDARTPGVYKSPDERFRHELCHELGAVPPQYELVGDFEDEVHTNRQHPCGHTIYGPPIRQPSTCPVCTETEMQVTRMGELNDE